MDELDVDVERDASALETAEIIGRLQREVRDLQEAHQTKTEFVSMLAHELAGPMTTIVGFGQILRNQWDTIDEAKRAQVLDIMTKEVGRLARLANDLLDLSRMESGTLTYERSPFSLQALVESVLTVHTSLHANHTVEAEVPPEIPEIVGDRDRIRQVHINLLTNATRYSPGGSRVLLRARRIPVDGVDVAQVSVTDHGIGIPEPDRERIFGKFVMLPRPAWAAKGTGLGLYISKGIVEGHSGRMWVDSVPGKGSTFSFTLPLAG